MKSALLCVLAFLLVPLPSHAQVPVFEVTPQTSSIQFYVKSSVTLVGKFDKWEATLTFPSTDATTGVLLIKIDAATVDTGSGMKNNKLKSKDFFDVAENPTIMFRSTKVVQTGPVTFDVDGEFTIRGASKPQTLKLTISGKGTGSGTITGVMTFNRKDYGMNKGIPFVKIGDHVDVTINLKVKQVSGPRVVYKQ